MLENRSLTVAAQNQRARVSKRYAGRYTTYLLLAATAASGQEAQFGFASPATLSFFAGHTHRATPEPGTFTPAFRAVVYPSLKLGSNWFAYGAIQAHSEGYFYEELDSRDRAVDLAFLQAYIGYSRIAEGRSLTLKAGQLTSAFGSFPLRYDDSRNWLIDLPQGYGYYCCPVSVYGFPGAEIDVTLAKADFRAQFTNSSPLRPRHLWDSDQYANWTFGGGYTITQGFRVGASVAHGPYLRRESRSFPRGEARPIELPLLGYAVDVQWGRGRWNANGEIMRFQYPHRVIPYFFDTVAYGEVKFTLNPRWYLAGRVGGQWRTKNMGLDQSNELVVAFRPAKGHLIKTGYLALQGDLRSGTRDNVLGIQYVFSLNPPAVTWK